MLGNRRHVSGSVDRRIASGYTAGVFGDTDRWIGSRHTMAEWRPFKISSLDEEEISDVSLATFYLYDKEKPRRPPVRRTARFPIRLRLRTRLRRLRRQRLRRLSRLRRGSRLRRWLPRLQRLRRWLSRLRLWRLRRLRRLRRGLRLGRRLLLVLGRLRPLLDWSAVLLS